MRFQETNSSESNEISTSSEISRGDPHRKTTGCIGKKSVKELAANLMGKRNSSVEWQ